MNIRFIAFVAACTIAQLITPHIAGQTITFPGAPSVITVVGGVMFQEPIPGWQYADVTQLLEGVSELALTGRPTSHGALTAYFGNPKGGWNVRTIVDAPALSKHGIQLFEINPYEHIHAGGGISRRSSLRFVLDAGGLAYYVDDNTLVVTTKHIAKVKWLSQLDKPNPEALSGPAVAQRRKAAFAVAFWQLDPDTWLEPLMKALDDDDCQVSFDAAYALGELGPQAAPAIDRLVSLLKSDDVTRREAAVFALGHIGPQATDSLLELLDHKDSEIAIAASKSFNVMGRVGKLAIPSLFAAAKRHADAQELCKRIGLAIANIDPEGAVPVLRELLKSQNTDLRAFAANTIAELGPAGKSCAQELVSLLTHPNLEVRYSAARALGTMAKHLPLDFPIAELEAASKDDDEHVSAWAAAALRRIENSRKK